VSEADFVVTIKIKNARLYHAIRKAGFDSTSAFCRKNCLHYQVVSGFLTMRVSPLKNNGDWCAQAYYVSSALHCEPEDLWPLHIATAAARRHEISFETSVEDLISSDGVDQINNSLDLKYFVSKSKYVSGKKLLQARLEGDQDASFRELGEDLGVSYERVRQIEVKALQAVKDAMRKSRWSPN
jgi:hypothetical protein